MKYCFLQVSDNLINPVDVNNPADVYFKAIWNHLDGEGYFKPEHFWEIPLWIAELSYCLKSNELELFHIDHISNDRCYPVLPKADIYFGSIMGCNKEYFRIIAKNNPEKFFYFGGYIGRKEFYSFFKDLTNVSWCDTIQEVCNAFQVPYRYGTDYSLFKGMKCIPRLTLSNGCTNRCRFCTVPKEITQTTLSDINQQMKLMKDLDFELVCVNDKTLGQCLNYRELKYIYNSIKSFNPKFRGFTVQTTCRQILKFFRKGVNLKDLGIVSVELGIESYNDDILKKYNKPQNTKTIEMALIALKVMGVNIVPNIIIGLPGETWLTYANTDCWIAKNAHKFLMLNIFNFVPQSGSDVFDIVETKLEDLNEAVSKRSYHTTKEKFAIELFTNDIFAIGMEILKATKARSVCK